MQTEGSNSLGSPPPPAVNIRRLRFLTENYSNLQGLRLIPLGLVLLADPLLGRYHLFPVAVLIAFGLFLLIGVYYKRKFGRVQKSSASRIRSGLLLLLFGAGLLTAAWIEEGRTPPVSLMALVLAALFATVYLRSSARRRYYALAACFFLAISLLPLAGLATAGEIFGSRAGLGRLVLGGACVLVGILDHLLLVGSLNPIPAEGDDEDTIR